MRHTLILTAAILTASCAPAPAATPPTPHEQSNGGNFLPAYLDLINGKTPPDTACHPTTLEQLFLPCDVNQ